jgi:transcriptional regulator with XRE-family HTH domain
MRISVGRAWQKLRTLGDGRQNQAVSIGEVLAEARHRRGLTVAEVSHYTRIREPVIRAIERDEFLLSGSDFETRGQIRILGTALGVDPGPLIAEYDASHRSAPELSAAEAVRSTIPFRIRKIRRRRRIAWRPALAVLVLAAIGVAAYFVVSGRGPVSGGTASRGTVSGGTASAGPGSSGTASAGQPPAGQRGTPLVPVRVLAVGPHGPSDGDNPQFAALAIDRNPATAWTTGWYGTPRFANAQQGTGLLVDMGRVVTITGAEVTLGATPGAGFQMRAGDTSSLASLPEVAVATNAHGPLGVRLATPVHARYVLIWFTALPPAGSGTFQAAVYNVTVLGVKPS